MKFDEQGYQEPSVPNCVGQLLRTGVFRCTTTKLALSMKPLRWNGPTAKITRLRPSDFACRKRTIRNSNAFFVAQILEFT